MKNEKIVKVCSVVVQVCNIAIVIAKTIMTAFPVNPDAKAFGAKDNINYSQLSPEDLQLIKEFQEHEEVMK